MAVQDLRIQIDKRKRAIEWSVAAITFVILVGLILFEKRLYNLSSTLSESREFFSTVSYFALINFNVILILLLSFLIFRNVTKLIVERRKGALGSSLRTKLVVSLVFFAIAPTLLLFYISSKFIISSFDTWFSEKVQVAMEKTREAGFYVYKQDQKRVESLARIGLQRIEYFVNSSLLFGSDLNLNPHKLKGFDSEYGLSAVRIFDVSGVQTWASNQGSVVHIPDSQDAFLEESISLFTADFSLKSRSTVVSENQQDVVKGVAPVRHPITMDLLGIIVTEMRFETQILKSVESILSDFADLKPGAQLIRVSFIVLMLVITFLIVFSATWLGFYVAGEISRPLQGLAEATREIALGNYGIWLEARSNDETGQLVQAFNVMARDLREHERRMNETQSHLRITNRELEQRRRYMEFMLQNISAGVISIDSDMKVTSINAEAKSLLSLSSEAIGQDVTKGLGLDLVKNFWEPIIAGLEEKSSFHGEISLTREDREQILIVDATRVLDDHHVEIGYVVVFDDARVKLLAQRAAAWREVARRIAHEIKNPITPIKLSAQRLLRRLDSRFDAQEQAVVETCLETIIKQVDTLRDLVNEFSRFARLPKVKKETANLAEVLEEAERFFSMSYPIIKFRKSISPDLPLFEFDKEQINRVFVNILGNAVAAVNASATKDPLIEIDVETSRECCTIRVSDNGPGIPTQLKDRVIEPYFSTREGGTGLGLAIANQIVIDHGGKITFSDNTPRGTIVAIELPLAG